MNVWKRDGAASFPAIYVFSGEFTLNLSDVTMYKVKVEMKVRVKVKMKVEVRKRNAAVTFPGICVSTLKEGLDQKQVTVKFKVKGEVEVRCYGFLKFLVI